MGAIESDWSTQDGLTIHSRTWIPDRETKGVICLIHGLGEHSGRYAHVAERLNSAGYAVFAFDLRGHGLSGGKRGHIPSLELIYEDIDELIRSAKFSCPNKPLFLYGHSLGSILALSYTLTRKPDLTGIVVTGLGLRTALHKQKLKIALAKVFGSLLPGLTLASGLEPMTICSDPSIVNDYICDPLVHDRISFGMSIQLLKAIDRLFAQASEIHIPLLIMHGRNDQLGYSEGSEEFAGLVQGDRTLKIWDGMSHEIHNEPGKDEVLSFLIDWLDMNIQPQVIASGQSQNLMAKFGGNQ
jgi:alpha-beta hydrolase superfamily lysophospholipase